MSLPHVLWRFDGRNKFECSVSKSHKANGSTKDVVKDAVSKEDRPAEHVDCTIISPIPRGFK
jgi:hypothetical protein